MKTTFLAIAVACSTLLSAQHAADEKGISFEHGTWQDAVAKAKREKKLIMLDAYASWCGPCKWMVKNIFPQNEVGEFYNKNFVSIKLDMEKDSSGIRLAKKYNVSAYPTFVYIDPSNENMVHQICGSMEANDFVNVGKIATDDENRMTALRANYLADTKNADLALKYFEAAEGACMKIEDDVKKYMDNLKPEQYLEKGNYALIDKFVGDYSHASIVYILNNYEKFTDKFGRKKVDEKIKGLYRSSLNGAARKRDETKFKDVQASYRVQKNAPVEWLDAYSKVVWAGSTNDTTGYFTSTIAFVDKFFQDDDHQLNSSAWEFYEKTNTQAYLLKAEAWAKRAVEISSNYANNDTYASVLYKLGKFSEAKAVATKAIEIGKKDKEEVKETEELMKKINDKLKA